MTPEEKLNQPQPESQNSDLSDESKTAKEGSDSARKSADSTIAKPPDAVPGMPEAASGPDPAARESTSEATKSEPEAKDQLLKVRVSPEGDKLIDRADLPPDSEYDPEEYQKLSTLYEKTLTEIKEGEIVSGRIVAISDKDIAVDIGFKSEGTVPIEEFSDPAELKIGHEIEVYLDRVENQEGQLILSKKKAEFMKVWARIKAVYENNETIEGKIIRRIKGGMVVDLMGVDSFLPGSQVDVHPVRDFDALVGKMMDFRIVKINDIRKNVVLSHKILVEESLAEIRQKILGEMKVGNVLDGVVKNITDFGVFVDLGGVDGLLHITDLSWGRVTHPSEIVNLDQKIRVKVLDYDQERQRISLGLKQLTPHPWEGVEERYPVGSRIMGKVVSIARYGAFVELEKGVEGLVHISEMSWTQNIKHPSMMVSVGNEVEVVVLGVDVENRKISLGMKQIEPDPWENLEAKYRAGTIHKGIVRDLVPFGAFVELEEGIEGLVHISDLSWTRKVRHPGEIVKKGEEIDVQVLGFDRNERRISLGYKQTQENPWDRLETELTIRTPVKAKVVRILEKGVVVMLPQDVEGFVPNSHLRRYEKGAEKRTINVNDELDLVVIEFDKEAKKIILSAYEAEKTVEDQEYQEYLKQQAEAPQVAEAPAETPVTEEKPELLPPAEAPQEEEVVPTPEPMMPVETVLEAPAEEVLPQETAEAEPKVEEVAAELKEEPAPEVPKKKAAPRKTAKAKKVAPKKAEKAAKKVTAKKKPAKRTADKAESDEDKTKEASPSDEPSAEKPD